MHATLLHSIFTLKCRKPRAHAFKIIIFLVLHVGRVMIPCLTTDVVRQVHYISAAIKMDGPLDPVKFDLLNALITVH